MIEARFTSAIDLASATPDKTIIDKVRAAAFSKRFILLWRDPLILAYLGEHGDYILVDHHYCSCEGFTRRIRRDGLGGCTHVYASKIALEKGWFRDYSDKMNPEILARIVWEALTGGSTYTLRRLIALAEDVGDSDYDGEGRG